VSGGRDEFCGVEEELKLKSVLQIIRKGGEEINVSSMWQAVGMSSDEFI